MMFSCHLVIDLNSHSDVHRETPTSIRANEIEILSDTKTLMTPSLISQPHTKRNFQSLHGQR